MIEILVLDKSHTRDYRDLRLRSFLDSPLSFSESYEDESKKSVTEFSKDLESKGDPAGKFVLGAFNENQELVGFVTFKRDTRFNALHKSMVHAMYVAPEARNQKVGTKLMEALLEKVKQLNGLEQIHLWVLHSEGQSASAFYSKLGFESQGPFVKKDIKIGDTYVDAEYMVLYL